MADLRDSRVGALIWSALGGDIFERTLLANEIVHSHVDAEAVSKLISLPRLAEILTARRLAPPRLRLFRDGKAISHDRWLSTRLERRKYPYRQVDWSSVEKEMEAGCTLILDSIDELDPVVGHLAEGFAWWLHDPVHVNGYFAFGPGRSFLSHADDHDVIVVQVAGEKIWRVVDPCVAKRTAKSDQATASVWENALVSGDVLHIPRGWRHEARSEHDLSIHLTIGVHRRTGSDWVRWLATQIQHDPDFRKGLRRHGDFNDMRTHHEFLVKRLADYASEYSVSSFLESDLESAEPHAHLSFPNAGAGGATSIRILSRVPPRLVRDEHTVTLYVGGKRIVFGVDAETLLARICQGGVIRPNEARNWLHKPEFSSVVETLVDARVIGLETSKS